MCLLGGKKVSDDPNRPELSIKEWLKLAGYNQMWLARQLGKSPQYISLIARKNNPDPCSPAIAFAIEDLSYGRVKARKLILREQDPFRICLDQLSRSAA
jgi:hypothetical protein